MAQLSDDESPIQEESEGEEAEEVSEEEDAEADDDDDDDDSAVPEDTEAEDDDEDDDDADDDDADEDIEAETADQILWHGPKRPVGQTHKNLWQAAWDGDQQLMQKYLAVPGVDVNALGLDGFGFGIYLRDNREYVVVHLWEKNQKVAHASPLHFAVCANDVDMCKMLLEPPYRANPVVELPTTGATPKDVARMNNCRAIVTLFDQYTGTFDVESPGYLEIKKRTEDSQQGSEMFMKTVLGRNVVNNPVADSALRAEWAKWDTKNQGVISRATLRKVYESKDDFGLNETEEEVEQLLDRFTGLMDNDKVCYEEFAALLCHLECR